MTNKNDLTIEQVRDFYDAYVNFDCSAKEAGAIAGLPNWQHPNLDLSNWTIIDDKLVRLDTNMTIDETPKEAPDSIWNVIQRQKFRRKALVRISK